MSSQPRDISANDVFRFALELTAVASFAYWGWTVHAGTARWLWGVGLPVVVMAIWGTFRVDGDPGPAPVAVTGPVRLAIEAVVFGAAAVLAGLAVRPPVGAALAGLVALHYWLDRGRVRWLLSRA